MYESYSSLFDCYYDAIGDVILHLNFKKNYCIYNVGIAGEGCSFSGRLAITNLV